MSFPPAFLDELRARLPLSEIVGKRVRLTRAGREFKACCPFHNEKTPSFYVNDDKQFYHCFGCGAHGDVIGFTMQHDRLSFPEAVESLAAQAGLPVPQNTPMDRERFDKEKGLYQLLERATAWFEEQLFAPAGREALNYLRGRGLGDEAIRRFRLGYAPNEGQALIKKLTSENYKIEDLIAVGLVKKSEERNEIFSFFRNRVMFPVGDRRGRTVAFGARIMGEGEPKYLNSPDHSLFHKGKLLYGLSRARTAITQNQPLIVVEGYMDVIALVEAGYSGAVAPLGTALTEDQLTLLWKLLPPFEGRDPARDYSPILCFDGDNAGLRAAARSMERVLPLLTSAQTIRIATMPEGQDPDDLIKRSGKSAMQNILTQAKPMIDVIWEMTLAGRQLRTPEERGAFIAAIKQRVGRIANENLRHLYQDEIQKRLTTLFQWRSNAAANEPQKSFRKGPPQTPIPFLSRKQPLSPQRLRERALLALMINHPDLFADLGEDLAHIGFSTPEFEALRQRVVEILSLESQEPLDATELYRHLSPSGGAGSAGDSGLAGLAEVLSETTYMHAGFARPGRPLDQARQGWKSIWNKYLQEQLNVDIQAAKRRYAEETSDTNLAKLMALSEQMQSLIAESGEATAMETSSFMSQEG
ncbi:MAG: DNA primase [Alphaproteobacteria bacterium]|nr:DNA primase [Alphaproteobacteria bacterium]